MVGFEKSGASFWKAGISSSWPAQKFVTALYVEKITEKSCWSCLLVFFQISISLWWNFGCIFKQLRKSLFLAPTVFLKSKVARRCGHLICVSKVALWKMSLVICVLKIKMCEFNSVSNRSLNFLFHSTWFVVDSSPTTCSRSPVSVCRAHKRETIISSIVCVLERPINSDSSSN